MNSKHKLLTLFVLCGCAFVGCSSKPADRAKGLDDEQKAIYEEFRTLTDRVNRIARFKEDHIAKSARAKISTQTLKKLSNYYPFIDIPPDDIKIEGSTATVTVSLEKMPQPGEVHKKEWKMVKEDGKWKLTDIDV